MKRLILVAVVAALSALIAFRLYEHTGAPAAAGGAAFGPPPTLLVETDRVRVHTFQKSLEVLGQLEAKASVDVMSRVSGQLQELSVDRGDAVRQGELLARIDDADLLQQISRAEASIAVARAGVSRDKATAENLQVQANRYRTLHEEALVSTEDLEGLESRLRAATAQVELSRAQVAQAEAALRELNIRQGQTRIYSPLTGFVGTRHLDPGALVNPNTPIVTVLNVAQVKTIVPVTELELQHVRLNLAAEITVDAYPGARYQGRVTRISPFLDPATRSADVEIEIANPEGALKPGMSARVLIDAEIPFDALCVPRDALLTRSGRQGVFLLSEERDTIFRSITIGRIADEVVEVREGLDEGMEIVTVGAQRLNNGDRVRTR